jgi:putative DNA primase/helicase
MGNIEGYDQASGTFENYGSYKMWEDAGRFYIPKPSSLKPIFNNIPDDLKDTNQWVTWKYCLTRNVINKKEGRVKVWAKVPDGKTNDPSTWGTFAEVAETYKNGGSEGIGFVFEYGSGFTGIDLDESINSDGSLTPLAEAIISKADSFSEVSVSSTGVHIYLRADICGGRRNKSLEIYGDRHFFIVTGHPIKSFGIRKIRDNQPLADLIYRELSSSDEKYSSTAKIHNHKTKEANKKWNANDDEIIRKIFASNDAKSQGLFNGNWQKFPEYPSQSEADLGFFKKLLYWTHGDAVIAERIFLKSGLYRPKWDRSDYRNNIIAKAGNY